jgi:hypothetical protein
MSGIFYGFVGSGGNIHMLEVNISLDAFYLWLRLCCYLTSQYFS